MTGSVGWMGQGGGCPTAQAHSTESTSQEGRAQGRTEEPDYRAAGSSPAPGTKGDEMTEFAVWMSRKDPDRFVRGMVEHRVFYVTAPTRFEAVQAARKAAKVEKFTGAKVTTVRTSEEATV